MDTDINAGAVLAPIGRGESLSEKVYRRLRGALVGGRLAPGQKLVHRMFAKELGVSPTPVRDALLRLVSEGALELDARGIAWVPRLAPDRYAEIMELRTELEGRAAARAAELATPDDVADLRAIQARLIDGRRRRDADIVLAEHERFHSRIIAIARMPVLQRMVESLWIQAGPTLHLLANMPSVVPLKDHPHAAVLDALEARDPVAARAAIARDLQVHGAAVIRMLREDSIQSAGSRAKPRGTRNGPDRLA
jgi:DNA-binding GntR family transcriptional regulator